MRIRRVQQITCVDSLCVNNLRSPFSVDSPALFLLLFFQRAVAQILLSKSAPRNETGDDIQSKRVRLP